jgi:excisionase family DNA binding protein
VAIVDDVAMSSTESNGGAGHLLTLDEAASRMRVSRRTAARLAERGQLPAVRVGAQWRVDADELERQLQPWRMRPGQTADEQAALRRRRLDEIRRDR